MPCARPTPGDWMFVTTAVSVGRFCIAIAPLIMVCWIVHSMMRSGLSPHFDAARILAVSGALRRQARESVMSPKARFALAEELRSRRGARLGDIFEFVSGL